MQIDLNGLTFSGPDTIAAGRWKCLELRGWDSPEQRQVILEATGRHGGRIPDGTYATRKMVLVGKAFAKPGYSADDLQAELARVTDLVTKSALLTVHEAIPKRCRVHRAGSPDVTRPTNTRIEFAVPLVAADPVKYSTVLVQTTLNVGAGSRYGDILIPNAGDFPIEPEEITIHGDGKPPITITRRDVGDTVRLTVGLGSGRYVIDPQQRNVKFGPGGSERHRYRYVARGPQWPVVPPGGSSWRFRRASTTGSMIVNTYSRGGWI